MGDESDPEPPCPACGGHNTVKSVESLLTEIHICRDCHRTFIVRKPEPDVPAPPPPSEDD